MDVYASTIVLLIKVGMVIELLTYIYCFIKTRSAFISRRCGANKSPLCAMHYKNS